MTCIVGYIDSNTNITYLGGDSMGSNGYSHDTYENAKIFHCKIFPKVIIGGTTSFRHLDLLQYSKDLFPELDTYKNVEINHEYMVNEFIPRIYTLFSTKIYSENTKNCGAEFIVGVPGKLFKIQADFSVLEPINNFLSVGSGSISALGSLYTTSKYYTNTNPIDHIKFALESAENNVEGVFHPFRIINTQNDEIINIV